MTEILDRTSSLSGTPFPTEVSMGLGEVLEQGSVPGVVAGLAVEQAVAAPAEQRFDPCAAAAKELDKLTHRFESGVGSLIVSSNPSVVEAVQKADYDPSRRRIVDPSLDKLVHQWEILAGMGVGEADIKQLRRSQNRR